MNARRTYPNCGLCPLFGAVPTRTCECLIAAPHNDPSAVLFMPSPARLAVLIASRRGLPGSRPRTAGQLREDRALPVASLYFLAISDGHRVAGALLPKLATV